jgi:cyclopropane-fatty-acyl-phospholipid synthase
MHMATSRVQPHPIEAKNSGHPGKSIGDTIANIPSPVKPDANVSIFDRLLYSLFSHLIQTGTLTIVTPSGETRQFGPGEEPFVKIRLHEPGLSRKLALNPALAIGEAYMDGALSIERGTLHDFLHVCTFRSSAAQPHVVQQFRRRLQFWTRYMRQYNPVHKASSNVRHHYDLSDQLYELFLDADRQYSCAYFPDGTETLEQAQSKKKAHIAAKLLLKPGMQVLDIGSGWGGLALYLAKTAGVSVTGLTLSQEQYRTSLARVKKEELSERVRFFLQDYREEAGIYDRIVSVGMFEHVGRPHYREFFNAVRHLLKPDGVAMLHAIGRNGPPADTNPWIQKYIFPGGYCPALSEVATAIEQSGLWVTDVEILRPHYADTLHAWYERFQAARKKAEALYDERFCRMWEFYLASSEIAFRNGSQMVFQIQLARSRHTVPRHRDYITDQERRAQARMARAA